MKLLGFVSKTLGLKRQNSRKAVNHETAVPHAAHNLARDVRRGFPQF